MSPTAGAGVTRRAWLAAAAAAIAVLPAILTYALVHLHLGASIGDFVPSLWNDQVGYWHQILSFKEHGFESGYYAADEHLPPLEFNRFEVGGPFFMVLYGGPAALTGWSASTSIGFNLVVLGAALAAFVWFMRLEWRGVGLVAVLVVCLGPLLLYIPTSSQESVQQAIAVVLAIGFSRLLVAGAGMSPAAKLTLLAFLIAASMLRFSWALLFVPFFLLAYPGDRARRLAALAGSAGLIAAILAFSSSLNPPGENSVLTTLGDLPADPGGTIGAVASDTWRNVRSLLDPAGVDVTVLVQPVNAVSLQAWLFVALLAVSIVALAGLLPVHGRREGSADVRREWAFHAYNLGTILVGSLMLYLPNGYYRVLGANLLLSLLIMIGSRRYLPVLAIAGVSVLMLPSFLDIYGGWKTNFAYDTGTLRAQSAALSERVRYEDHPASPWCNTLLLPIDDYDYRVTLVPAGFGIAYLNKETLESVKRPLKSRYLLLGPPATQRVPAALRPSLRRIGDFSFGVLYENAAAHCGSSTASRSRFE